MFGPDPSTIIWVVNRIKEEQKDIQNNANKTIRSHLEYFFSLMQKMEQIRHEYIQLLSIRVSSCLDVGTKSALCPILFF
jgi:hypothetical protein